MSVQGVHDIAVRRDADEASERTLRLETLGRLTNGIAHDFNNLLTVIMGASETLAEGLAGRSDEQDLALVSLRAAERASALIQQLLAFSRREAVAPQTIDCGAMIESVRSLSQHLVGARIALGVEAPRRPLCCRADPVGLESALLNFLINARDAMPNGGVLSLQVDTVSLTGREAERLSLSQGPYVVFIISDTGCGMSSTLVGRATELFFTTKSKVGGSGLGLSNADGFARRSAGHLSIASEPGLGTSVSLYLPRAKPMRPRLHATHD